MKPRPQIAPERVAAARRRVPLSSIIGGSVRLTKRGAEHVGLCPFHNEKTASVHVIDGKGFYHCFGCGAHGDAITWTMTTSKLGFADAIAALDGGVIVAAPEIRKVELARDERDEKRRRDYRELARSLWASSAPIAGTPGEGYFRGRGITIPLPPTLRFHPRVVFGRRETRRVLPAVVAAVQGPNGAIDAVHRIFLDPRSIDAGRPTKAMLEHNKALLGTVKGGAVRFARVAADMVTCEGIETGAAALQARPDLALWVGIDTAHMAAIVWPAEVRSLLILADRDPMVTKRGPLQGKRPGEEFASRTAAQFIASGAGRAARIAVPRGEKCDLNDVLLGSDGAGAVRSGKLIARRSVLVTRGRG
jgi:DNA primase